VLVVSIHLQRNHRVAARIAALPFVRSMSITEHSIHVDVVGGDPSDDELEASNATTAWLEDFPEFWCDADWLHCDGHTVDFRSVSAVVEGVTVTTYEHRRTTGCVHTPEPKMEVEDVAF
jgi:hypothetical protein